MKKYFEGVCLLWLIFLFCSCASQPVPSPDWIYEEEAIKLHLKADHQLNLSGGMPHTLLLCVYQLRDPNIFNQFAEDEDGLYKLLECSLFDPSVAGCKSLIIHPGQTLDIALNRAEGAKYMAFVAGYYLLHKERIVRLFDIPVISETKGCITRTKISKPGPLNLDITLGPQQIQKIGER